MQNLIPKLRQTSIISKKPDFLSEKLKTLTSSKYHRFYYFWLKLCTRFLLSNAYKRVWGIFLFCLDLECKTRVCRKQVKLICQLNNNLIFRNSYRRCSVEKVLLEILKSSQQNTCARNFIKKETLA